MSNPGNWPCARSYDEAVLWVASVGYKPQLGQLIAYLYGVNIDQVRHTILSHQRNTFGEVRHD